MKMLNLVIFLIPCACIFGLTNTAPSNFLDKTIDGLKYELHIPGYHYCGPGTKLSERLSLDDQGINILDKACKLHDIAYTKYPSGDQRQRADAILATQARMRSFSRNATIGERYTAKAVAYSMLGKFLFGARSQNHGLHNSTAP